MTDGKRAIADPRARRFLNIQDEALDATPLSAVMPWVFAALFGTLGVLAILGV